MKLSRIDYIRITVIAILTVLFLFANFYTVRRMMSYGMEAYLYDKLLVAYRMSGERGLHKELNNVLAEDKGPRILKLARDFEARLPQLKNPAEFLDNRVREDRAKVNLMRKLRTGAFTAIFALFLLRIFLSRKRK